MMNSNPLSSNITRVLCLLLVSPTARKEKLDEFR